MTTLHLKESFKLRGEDRMNNMKLKYQDDGSVQVFIHNGVHQGLFRINKLDVKQLIAFLQKDFV